MSYPTERGVAGRVVAYSIAAVLLVGVIAVGIWAFRVATADVKGTGDAEIKTSGGDYRIAAYDQFIDLCADVQAKEDAIAAQQAEIDATTTSEQRREILRTNLTALNASRARLIRKYNGDASKDFTVGQFRDSDLPYRLDPDQETTCKP